MSEARLKLIRAELVDEGVDETMAVYSGWYMQLVWYRPQIVHVAIIVYVAEHRGELSTLKHVDEQIAEISVLL
jgi:hypothetical protein